jgi:hypothetical protein
MGLDGSGGLSNVDWLADWLFEEKGEMQTWFWKT